MNTNKIRLGPNSYILPLEHKDLKSTKIGYAYLRCSTEMQVKDSGSVEAQLAAIMRYIKGKDIVLVAAYVDAAVSGIIEWEERIALKTLVNKLRSGEVVVAYDVSRFGRDAADTLTFSRDMRRDKNVEIHITTIGDITGDQKLTFGIMAVLAEQERDQISARIKNAMGLLRDKGELKCRPRFGEKHTGAPKGYIPDPEAIKVIDYLREMKTCDPNVSYRAMTRAVNENFEASVFKKKAWYPNDIIRYCKANNI